MAAFIAKQMLGNQLSAVKDVAGEGKSMTPEEKEKLEEMERERLEALAEAEQRRKEKHQKLEAERENMRQGIRDKYGIKKKEEKEAEAKAQLEAAMGPPNPVGPKKTPEQLAAETEEQDDFTRIKSQIETQVNEIKTQIEGKCTIQ